jgi:hypothetical protein
MKKNILLIIAIALVGSVTLTMSSLRAQNDAPPAGAPPQGAPPAGQPPQGPRTGFAGPRGRPTMGYRQVIFMLKRTKADLERSKEDYDGHRQTALDAVDKAVQELEAVQASIQAADAAKAAAAKAAAAQQAPPPATPAPQQ